MHPRSFFMPLIVAGWLLVSAGAIAHAHADEADTATLPTTTDVPASTPPTDDLSTAPPLPGTVDPLTTLRDLRQAVRTTPGDAATHLRLAEVLSRLGDLDAALDACRTALSLNPDHAPAHVQWGVLLILKQDWRQAAAALNDALRLDPMLTQAHYLLGTVHYALGHHKAAIQAYQRTIELQPDFPDAHYRLALLLKLTNRPHDAIPFMETAASGGIPHAQFFLGQAYRNGQGVPKDLAKTIAWWSRAEAAGHQPAADALSTLRRHALAASPASSRNAETREAFRVFREQLWTQFPDFTRTNETDSLGATLLQQHRFDEALPILLQETAALSEPAQQALAQLYETGWPNTLRPFDRRLLRCFDRTAADGLLPSKKTLARIYATGLGVAINRDAAKAALKGLPQEEQRRLLKELILP